MQRRKTRKRGRTVLVLVAGGIGYLIGGWQTAGLRGSDPSAAQSVALRFPQEWNGAAVAMEASAPAPATMKVSATGAVADAQFVLFSPQPMVPTPARPAAPQEATADNASPTVARPAVQTAALDLTSALPAPAAREPARPSATAQQTNESRSAAAARHRADRPGYLLDDAQIASIKRRLNMTPDQERMWPAVEAALRNIAYAKAREEHRRGAAPAVQTASVDPDSAEVQGLKSAAVPLIMSFNAEQKEEVRNLAHVMGLDQLATQF
jgi:hypothetical protein